MMLEYIKLKYDESLLCVLKEFSLILPFINLNSFSCTFTVKQGSNQSVFLSKACVLVVLVTAT